jgi:Fe-S-cluster-containing hydrogenase component 2
VPLESFLAQGLMEAQSLLVLDLEKCTRCDACVTACADSHDGVTRLVREGLRFENFLVATSCRQCRDPLCMVGCPVGAIRRRNSLEVIIEDWCTAAVSARKIVRMGTSTCIPLRRRPQIMKSTTNIPDKKRPSCRKKPRPATFAPNMRNPVVYTRARMMPRIASSRAISSLRLWDSVSEKQERPGHDPRHWENDLCALIARTGAGSSRRSQSSASRCWSTASIVSHSPGVRWAVRRQGWRSEALDSHS